MKVLINKIKMNKYFKAYKKMLFKGTQVQKLGAIVVPLLNLYIFSGFFAFVFTVIIDYFFYEDLKKHLD